LIKCKRIKFALSFPLNALRWAIRSAAAKRAPCSATVGCPHKNSSSLPLHPLDRDEDLFVGIAHIAIDGYATARDDGRIIALISSFQFMQDSGKFELIFVPLFPQLKIVMDELFKRKLSDYFSAIDIEQRELVIDSVSAPLRGR
jgi:hypothetical protein